MLKFVGWRRANQLLLRRYAAGGLELPHVQVLGRPQVWPPATHMGRSPKVISAADLVCERRESGYSIWEGVVRGRTS